ncbi:MAG: sulfatase [Opitutales bacterium]|nr:sulfatase [Opitutales bacterium]
MAAEGETAPFAAGSRPNILFLVSEDHGPELGIYGDPFARTPVLDRLGAEGVLFERAYVTQAGCSPSRATLFTGLYPHQNGQIGLATHGFRLYDDPEMLLLPNALKEAGYRTGIVGKIHVEPEDNFAFDETLGGDSFQRRDVRAIARRALRFIERHEGDGPFYLSVNYADVHRPYIGDFVRQADGLPEDPHEPGEVDILPQIGFSDALQLEKAANYYNSIERLDAGIGIILEGLKAMGHYENTIIIFLSDHGSDKLRGKRTVYEGGTRVPMIIHGADRIVQGQRRTELISSIDLIPTVLELAGVDVPAILPGKSLLPILAGEAVDWRQYLFTEYHTHSPHNLNPQRTVRDDRYKLIHNLLHGRFNPGYAFTFDRIYDDRDAIEALIAQGPIRVRNAYAIMKEPPEFELYDLHLDPLEFNNLAENPHYADILARLQEELLRWRRASGDPLLEETNLMSLDRDIAAAFRDDAPIVRDGKGHWVLGRYRRIPRMSDHWAFYGQWETSRREFLAAPKEASVQP